MKIDGLTITRSSNQIDDLIEGVKLTVNGPGSVVMDITQDAEKAVTGIQDYVSAFNDLMDWINLRLSESSTASSSQKDDQYKNDDFYKKFGLLHGNSLLWQTKSQIRQIMTNPVTAKYSLKTGRPVQGTMESAGLSRNSTFTVTVGVRTATIEVTPSDTLQTIAGKINSSYEMTHDPQGRTYPIPMASARVVNNQLVLEASPNRKFSLAASDGVLDTLGLGTPFTLLSQIGISTESTDYGKSGKLEFDSDKFMEALRNDPDGVAAIMNTVMGKMDDYIGNMVDTSQVEVGYTTAPKGRIASQITTWQTEIATIDKRIAESEARLELRARGLYEQFAQAEVNLAKLQQQASWLASIVSQLSGTDRTPDLPIKKKRPGARKGSPGRFFVLSTARRSPECGRVFPAKAGRSRCAKPDGRLGPVPEVELLENVTHMVLHRLLRKHHPVGNFRVAQSLGEPVEDFLLPGGQLVKLIVLLFSPGEGGKELPSDPGIHVGLSPCSRADGGEQFHLPRGLEDETEHPRRGEGGKAILVVVGAYGHIPGFVGNVVQFPDKLDAVHPGHVDVEKKDVRLLLPDEREGFFAVACLSDNGDIRFQFQELFYSVTKKFVIVRYEHPDQFHFPTPVTRAENGRNSFEYDYAIVDAAPECTVKEFLPRHRS